QGGGGVEQHDVPDRAGLAGQDGTGHGGVVRGVAAAQVRGVTVGDGEVGGVEPGPGGRAAAYDVDGGRARGGELVQAVVATEDQGGGAAFGQDAGDHHRHRLVVDADRLGGGERRVGERGQEVEDGGDA